MSRCFVLPVMVVVAMAVSAPSHAADVIKANNTNALNLGTSWTSGTSPTTVDVAVWNNTVTAANTVALGGDLSWQGIRLQSPGGKVTITGTANTLTLGSAGIGILTGTQQLEIQSRVALLTSQTWTLSAAPAGSQSLVFNAQAQPTAFTMGGNTLDVVGSGTVRFTSGSLLTGGTINVRNTMFDVQSGGSRTSAIGGDVAINVAAGKILRFGINSAPGGGLAVSSSAAIVLNSGTILIESSGANGTNRLVQSGQVSMSNGSGIFNASNFGYATQFTGGIAVTGSANWTETNGSTASTTFSGPLTGAGTLNVRNQATARRVEWSGDNSAFSGTVALNGASGNRTLRVTSGLAGSNLATWNVAGGNVLELHGVTAALGVLAGSGTIANSSASAATVSVSSGTFVGVLADGIAGGTLGLEKVGAGVLLLTGSNTYTGATLVQAGSLLTTTAQTGGGDVTVADGGTFGVTQVSAGATFTTSALTLGSAGGSTLSLAAAAAASAPVVTAAAFTVNGPTTLALTANAASGLSLVDYTGSIGGSGFGGLSLSLPFRVSGTLVDNVANTSVDLAGVQVNTPKWTGAVNAVWNVNTTGSAGGGGTPNWIESASLTPTTYIQAGAGQIDSVIFDDTATGPTAIDLVAAVTPVSITVDNSTLAYTISGTGSIGGATGIVKNGSQSLTLATANTFTGGITLNAGTLNLGNAGALGSGPLSLGSGVTLGNTSGSDIVAATPVAQSWAGDFTYAGPSSLDLGTAGSVTMVAGSQVTVASGTLAVGGISGSGLPLTKAGAGTLVVGANSYSGATSVSAGTLRAASTTSFSTSSGVTLADAAGATLDLNGFSQAIPSLTGGGTTGGNVTLGGATLTTGTASDATIGSLSGAGGLVKTGAGRLSILGGSAGFSGTTSITGGTLDVGPIAGTFGSGTISISGANFIQASGTLTQAVVGNAAGISARGGNLLVNVGGAGGLINMNSGGTGGLGQFNFGSASGDSRVIVSNTVGINNFGGTRTITANAGTGTAEVEFAAPITPGGAGGASGINKNGDGRVIYSAANTYSGDTRVNAGVLQLSHELALQNSKLDTAVAGTVELAGITTPTIGGVKGSADLASFITSGYGGVTRLTLNPTTGTAAYYGVIADGAAGMSVVKTGTGLQILGGANTYTGLTRVSAGTLALPSDLAIQFSPLDTSGAGVIDYTGASAIVMGGLSGGNDLATVITTGYGGISGITLNVAGSQTYAGRVTDGGAGMTVTKSGTGVQTLTGSNTYTGATTVNAGSLLTTTAQTGGGDVTVADGATFGVTQASAAATFTTSALTLGSAGGSTLSLTPAVSASVPVVTAAAFTVNGPTTLALTANAASGLSLVDYTGSIGGSGFGGLSLSLPFRVSGTLVDNVANTSVDLAGVQVNTPKWTGAVNAIWNVNTTGSAGGGGTPNWIESASLTPTTYIQAGAGQTDSVIFDDTATGPTAVNLVAAVTPVSITVNNSTLAYTISGTGSIGGATGIVKNGSQSLTLATANTFTGGITLNAGTLNLGHAQALGSGPLALGSGVTLGNTSGSDIVAAAPVAQSWAGDFTYAGPSSLDLGTGGSVTMVAGSQVTVSSGTLAVGGISGSGQSLTKAGAGTLVTGANSYSGATTVSGGTLRAATATSFTTTSGVTLTDVAGATLDLNGFSQTIPSLTGGGTSGGNVVLGGATLTTGTASDATIGSLSGAGGLVKTGTAELAIRGGVSAFTGTTSITGGSVDVGPVPAALGTLSMSNGGVLQGSGTLARTVGTGAAIVSSNGGFAARGGNLVLNLGGTSGIMNLSSGGNAFGGNFVFGTPTADSRVIVTNDIGVNNNGGSRTITVNAGVGGDAAEFTGSITPGTAGGVSGITKNGDGRLIYSGSNTYAGATTVNAGILQINHRFALQNSVPVLGASGTMELSVVDPVLGGLVGSTDAAAMFASGYGSVTSLTLNPIVGLSRTFSGVIANGAPGMSLTKSGGGTQVLEAVNTYTGSTLVTGGTLALAVGGSMDASPMVMVATDAVFDVSAKGGYVVPATQSLAGSGSIAGTTTVGNGATVSPGAGPGTLSFTGDLSWNSSGNYNWQMLSGTGTAGAADAWDLVGVAGGLSINATTVDPIRINLWTLSGTSPDVSGPAAGFDPAQDYTWKIATAAGGISGFAADKFRVVTSATNGTGGFANPTFGGTFAVAQTGNDLELVFTSSGTGTVITIHVASGTQAQTQAGYPLLAGSTPVVKTGAGTLVIDQTNTLTASTTVQGGVVRVAPGGGLGSSLVVPLAGGTLAITPALQTTIGGLRPNQGGLTDVGSGMITVAAGLSAADMLVALNTGRGDGTWNGTSGITSTQAAADLAVSIPRTVGWLDNGDGSVTFAFAAAGDTNLDWNVDILDAANFLAGGKFDSGTPATWNEGDFGYDGFVDILDAADFLSTGLFDAGSYNPPPGSGLIAAVPEPGMAGGVIVGLSLVLLRRRRLGGVTMES